MTNAETVTEWYYNAGGEYNFGLQLYNNFEFPGITDFHKSVLQAVLYFIEEQGYVTLEDMLRSAEDVAAKEWTVATIDAAVAKWRELGVLVWTSPADGPRQIRLLKSPLDVRCQLIVQVDGKTVLNTTDVAIIEKLTREKGRGTVRGKDPAE